MSWLSTVLDDYSTGLKGVWLLDDVVNTGADTAVDSSGQGHHLRYAPDGAVQLGYATQLSDGTATTSAEFAGATERAYAADASWQDNASITLFCRVRFYATSGYHTLAGKEDAWILRQIDQTLYFYLWSGYGHQSSNVINSGYDYTVALTIDNGGRGKLFIGVEDADGGYLSKIGDIAVGSAGTSSSKEFALGNMFLENLNGRMSAVGYWSTALSEADLLVLHQAAIIAPATAPNVPSDLAADVDGAEVTLTWAAPAGGGAVDHYEYRIDGSPPIDVGLDLEAVLELAPLTTYMLEVRAVNDVGASDWASLEVTTEGAILEGWDAHIRIGAHEWEFSSGDAAGDAPWLLAGLSFSWQAPQDRGWPPPRNLRPFDNASLSVYADDAVDAGDIRKGDVVLVSFTPNGYDAPLVLFAGRAGEPRANPHPSRPGVVYTVPAVSYLVDLASRTHAYTGTTTLGDSTDDIVDVLEAAFDLMDIPYPWDPGDGPAGSYGADAVFEGPISDLDLLAALRVTLEPNFDPDTGELDAARPWLFVGYDVHGADPLEVVALPAGAVPAKDIEWRRDYEPTYYEGPETLGWLSSAYGAPQPDVEDRITVRVSPPGLGELGASAVNGGGFANDVLLDEAWGPVRFVVRGNVAPSSVQGWLTWPERESRFVVLSGIEASSNPNGGTTVSGVLGQASFYLGADGRWSVTGYLRRSARPLEE